MIPSAVETAPLAVAGAPAYDELTAESALAAIGLDPWLRATPRFTGSERARVRGTGKRVAAGMLAFLSGEPVGAGPLHPITWKDAEALLYPSDPNTEPERAQRLTSAVRDPRLAMAIQNVAERALRYLQSRFPRIIRQSITGDTTSPPSKLEWSRFRDVWEVASNPEIVLEALAEGSLTGEQVAAVEALYPALYSAITQAAVDGVIDMRAKRARWTIPANKERLLGTLRQVETSTANLLLGADIQALYGGGGQGQEAPKKAPSGRSLKSNTDQRLTPGQRAES